MKLAVTDPVRLAAFTAARKALLATIRDPHLRERVDGELDCVAFRDGLVVKVPDEWNVEPANQRSREAAE